MERLVMARERIFYFCYDHNKPRGGQKQHYWHVDILNEHGFDAYAFHQTSDFRLTWFENQTRVVDREGFRRLYDPRRDYLVLPEDLGTRILDFPGRKVVFDKGLYCGAQALGMTVPTSYPYCSKDVIAVLSVSDHNRRHLQFAYPHLDIHHVHSGICTDTFAYRPLSQKRPLIVSIRKGTASLCALYHVLQARAARELNNGSRFDWIVLEGKSEGETAALLGDALLLIFLNTEEGLGFLPLEAMASGCVVVAHDAGPLQEYVPSECRFAHGDLLAMAGFIERVIASFPSDLDRWEPLVQKGRAIAGEYSLERQERSVLAIWDTILGEHSPRA